MNFLDDVIARLEKIEKIDLDERLSFIEKHLKFFSYACQSMDKSFQQGIQLSIDDQALNIITPLKDSLASLKADVVAIRQLRKELEQQIQSESIQGTLKFVAQRLHELTQLVHTIKEEGIKKEIQLALTMDGYEMVKRKPANLTDDFSETFNPEDAVIKLLDTFLEREKRVLIHRFGLCGEKPKTLEQTGAILGISRERIRAIQNKTLLKCRHASRRMLVNAITHLELRKAIVGY